MIGHMNLLSMALPEAFQFLNVGWWAVHIVAICLVGFIGFKIGQTQKGQ
jgi:hypothetical protein